MPYRTNAREDREAEAETDALEARLRRRHVRARLALAGLAAVAALGAGGLWLRGVLRPAHDESITLEAAPASGEHRRRGLLALTGAYGQVATQQARMRGVIDQFGAVTASADAVECPELSRRGRWYELHRLAASALDGFALTESWRQLRALAHDLISPGLTITRSHQIMGVAVGRGTQFELFLVGEVVERPTMMIEPGPAQIGFFAPGRFVGRAFLLDWDLRRITCVADIDVESSPRIDNGDGVLDDRRLLADLDEVTRRATLSRLRVVEVDAETVE